MKGELRQGDDDFALRTLIGAINDFRELRDPAEIQDFLRRPRPTGDRRWDTLLAASVARACRRRPGIVMGRSLLPGAHRSESPRRGTHRRSSMGRA